MVLVAIRRAIFFVFELEVALLFLIQECRLGLRLLCRVALLPASFPLVVKIDRRGETNDAAAERRGTASAIEVRTPESEATGRHATRRQENCRTNRRQTIKQTHQATIESPLDRAASFAERTADESRCRAANFRADQEEDLMKAQPARHRQRHPLRHDRQIARDS